MILSCKQGDRQECQKVYCHFTVLITPGHMLHGNIYVSGWKRAQKSSQLGSSGAITLMISAENDKIGEQDKDKDTIKECVMSKYKDKHIEKTQVP